MGGFVFVFVSSFRFDAAGFAGRLVALNLCVLSGLCVQRLLRVFAFS
jgi:hypothetical protein